METVINAKALRTQLASIMARVKKGERFTVLYRSHAVCRIVPLDEQPDPTGDVEQDSLFRAKALGRSSDGLSAASHDSLLYPTRRVPGKRKQ